MDASVGSQQSKTNKTAHYPDENIILRWSVGLRRLETKINFNVKEK